MATLRKLFEHCEFGNILNDTLRDRFVCGLKDENTQKRSLSKSDLTLQKAVEEAVAMDTATKDASDLRTTVDHVRKTVKSKKCSGKPKKNEKTKQTVQMFDPCKHCGKVIGMQVTISLNENAMPKFMKARPVPYLLKPKIEKELDILEEQGIISNMNTSEWASPIVPVVKPNGDVRTCGDFKMSVNQEMYVDKYPLPNIQDFFEDLSNGRKFTKLDLKWAYLHLEVDEQSRKILTINTRKGLYSMNRLFYKVLSAPAIWQCTIDEILQEYRANVTDREFHCDKEESIPLSLQCVYDEDGSGHMTGCRSGYHLQNCTTFACPEYTVKCPRSYCVPITFVCDGKMHCPNGEDELNCTCTLTERDVIIIVEDTNQPTVSETAAVKLAEQFYSPGSIIRLLHFKTTTTQAAIPITHELLEIREERITKFQEFTSEMKDCFYKSMARNLLHITRFSKTDGVVFIEDSVKSSSIANLMFSNLSRPSFFTYRVIKDSVSIDNKRDRYRFVKDIRIIRWEALFSIGYRRFPEICEAGSVVPCSGGYRCSSSQQCIPLEQICDGIAQCSSKDDEQLCDFSCPYNCSCSGYSVSCREANIKLEQVLALPNSTRSADISLNPEIHKLLEADKLRLPFLVRLNISSCRISSLSKKAFAHINNIVSLDIGHNEITSLPEHVFSALRHLRHLNLIGNVNLRVISSTAFHGLENINNLQITGTKLKRISAYTFSNLTVKVINISYNRIQEIEDFAFINISVEKLDLRGNEILIFNKHIFRNVTSLRELRTPAYKFCCILPCSVKESDCYPKRNEFSSCEDLMRHPVLQAVLWIVGIAALAGNLGSIIYRLGYDRARLKIGYGIFVTNLATADFLMGVYLIIIAVVDSLYRDKYIFKDEQWRNSKLCVTAGILSTVSSEASVIFVCLITLDRLLVIKYPFGTVKIGPKNAHIVCLISWIFAIALALVPIIFTDFFQNSFYSRSGVCIALPLTRDKPPGWMYSVAIFVGLNFCTFILVGLGQCAIFIELRKATSTIKKTQRSRKQDLKVARNLILVATTDFLCWFPIGVMGIMALSGYPVSGDAYAWTAVFILPLNSALNPVLYTLTAIIGKQKFNPSTEEQNRVELQKEISSAILQYDNSGRSMGITRGSLLKGTRSVQDLLKKEGSIPAVAAAAISLKLSKYLTMLHDSSIAVDEISKGNTYIRMNRKKLYCIMLLAGQCAKSS
ncbi:uncharacterized protein LOC123556154 [Mercenaria mercenaria]|uniref:uncharacterized protein LOC123556154 n=1 Tax=Mercenaria mercenaria TaxID=6596 RepID=UPI00234E57FE|nr:uncharacterized protein LOC123556154 [Mercenaria mercenaria]